MGSAYAEGEGSRGVCKGALVDGEGRGGERRSVVDMHDGGDWAGGGIGKRSS